jgi:mRNA interferase RelE/StbE
VNYRPVLSDEAAKTILRTDSKLRTRLQKRIRELADDPYDPRLSSPLSGRAGVRKSRVGGWRILFTVDRERQLVQVAAVDTRGQVYRH